jgi:hypothetical protein
LSDEAVTSAFERLPVGVAAVGCGLVANFDPDSVVA